MAFPFFSFPPFPTPPTPPTPPSGGTPGGVYTGPPRYNNAPTAATDSDAVANSIAEGAAVNTLVGITAHSTDAEQTVTYALGSDSSGGGFKIDPTTGVVTVADPAKINFETAPGHAYTITVNSSDGISVTPQSFTINVTDIAPSIPVDSNAAANTVAEGAAANTVVGITASATDINGPGVTYSLSNDANGAFKIDAATGVVSVADPSKIDFESTAPGHVLNITAVASDGTLSNSQNFTINVLDVALAAPTDGNGAANSVAEGGTNGSTVGVTALAADPNGPATTYSLIADTSLGGFTINATTGVVTVADSTKIDYETSAGHAYSVTVQATNGVQTTSQAFTIAVADVAPSAPVDSNGSANTVAEGAANGSTVGVTASSTDVNGPAGVATYSLIGDSSGGGFTINAVTGVVTVADSTKIDFETAAGHAYTVTAQASDGTLTNSQTFTIAVSDVAPSAPVDSNGAANSVVEGAANGSTVGVTALSNDVNGAAITYSLVGDTSGGGFTINAATGIITVADSTKIDYEGAAGHAYTVTAQASDGTLTTSQNFTISVADVAPLAPIDSNAGANTVAEGAANGSTVGVTASATDVNGPAVTYSLVGDTSGGGFTINAATGVITVADSTKINYETVAHAYTVTAQASDGNLTSSQAFVIAVTDVAPSTPVDSNGAANQVVAGSAVGATVGVTASATDVNGPAVTYSLVNDTSGGGFTINAASGVVTVADPSNILLADPSYDITIESSDGTLHSSQQTFTVNVITNLPPAIDSDGSGATAALSAAENQTAVTTVHANDPDNGPTVPVSYSIVGGDDQLKFAIDSTTGVLRFITAPDFENPTDTATSGSNTYIVTVRAFDGASSDDQTITVTVTDANDAPIITSNGGGATASININENSTAVTTVTSTDQDSPAQTLTYSLAGGLDQGKFSIDSSTGVLTFNTAPNFEVPTDNGAGNDYDVIVRVTDNGAGTLHDDQAITVHVQNVNEAPDTGVSTVAGNEDAASIAITINGTDVDGADSVASFHITNIPNVGTQGTLYSDAGLTTVVTEGANITASGNAATLYFVPKPDFNTHAGAVTFNAAATDSHGLTDATPATETINVTAVDDAPVNTGVPGQFTVSSGFTHVITGLSISDIDANEVGTPTDITTTLTSANGGIVTIGDGSANGGFAGGATITTNGSGAVILTGTVAQINTSLSGNHVVYTAADGVASSTTTTLTITTDDHGHNGVLGAATDTDIIQVGVIPQVWFIDQGQAITDGSAPRGSQANPFSDVHEFNISTGPGTNDYIYVKAGTYAGEGINLKDGQTLLGDDQALSLADPFGGPAIVIETASGARPTINVTTAGDQGIDLAQNNTIHGINITTATGTTGLDDGQGGGGNAVGNLTVDHMTISGAGQAVDIDQGGALNVSLDSVGSTGGAIGIELGGALTGTFTATTGALSGHTTSEFSVNGGTGNISYGGTIGNGSGLSASVASHTGGTVTLSGAITDNNDAGGGVSLASNTGGTINFTGGMTLDTGAANGFVATGGGTVNVTGTNHLTTTTATALNISNTTIGASNVTFHDISSNGGSANGIILDTTGSSGGLHVTGTGSTAGSGGTIANKSGADGSTTQGTGIYLNNTTDVQLNGMQLNDFQNFGIRGFEVNGFTLANSVINATAGTNGNSAGSDEGSVSFRAADSAHNGLTGTVGITNTTIANGLEDNFNVFNNSGSLNITVSGSTFRDTSAGSPGNDGLLLQADNTANITGLITNSSFLRNFARGIQVINNGSGNIDVDVGQAGVANSGGTFTDNFVGVDMDQNGAGTFNFNVLNAGFTTANYAALFGAGGAGSQINVNRGGAASPVARGLFTGNIDNNTINNADSGTGPGISVSINGTGTGSNTATIKLDSNNISHVANFGILLSSLDGNATLNATVTNNTVSTSTAAGLQAIRVNAGATSSQAGAPGTPDNGTINLDIHGNAVSADPLSGVTDIRVRQRFNDHFNIEGYGGSATDDAAVAAYLASLNTHIGGGAATVAADHNVIGFGTTVAVTEPAAPLLAAAGGVQALSPTAGEMHLTQAQLDSVVAAAIAQWQGAGASAAQLAALHATTFSIADLAGSVVGQEMAPAHITIDVDAAGHGWFVDPTPYDNSEFTVQNAARTEFLTDPSNAAAGHLDLLTTVSHELGHVLGLPDSTSPSAVNDLMYIYLADGERRLPGATNIALAPTTNLTPAVSVGPAGNAGNVTTDAGHGGGFVFGGGADGFVFANVGFPAAPPAPVTHVTDYGFAAGDRFNFSAPTPQFLAAPGFAQIDGAHAGDAFNAAIGSHAAVDVAQFHVGWLI